MAAAGLGALYLSGNLLGVGNVEKPSKDIPSALREIKSKGPKEPPPFKSQIDAKLLRDAESRGNEWFAKNFKVQVDMWNLYYLYAFERYKSIAWFSEHPSGEIEKDPEWYSDIARFLIEKQSPTGVWAGQGCGDVPDTAFGVLFLLRSMQKSIIEAKKLGGGLLKGGQGIPKDTTDLFVGRDGKLKDMKREGPGEALLAALENQDDKDFDKKAESLDALPQATVEAMSSKQAAMIRQLVGHRKYEARLAAVKTLGKVRNLDNVPVLIYALTDPMVDIAREANEALLRISRSNDQKYRLSDNPTDSERRALIEKWKAWYRAIRPDADVDL